MFEIRPVWNFLPKRASCVFVSLNGRQRGSEAGQEARARGLERPLELLRDLDGGAAQDLGVELVGAALDLVLELEEAREDRRRVLEGEAVALRLVLEGGVDARLPVDQRAVDVERDPSDLRGERHMRLILGIVALFAPGARGCARPSARAGDAGDDEPLADHVAPVAQRALRPHRVGPARQRRRCTVRRSARPPRWRTRLPAT